MTYVRIHFTHAHGAESFEVGVDMTTVLLNPGTEWVDGNRHAAAANLRELMRDAGVTDYEVTPRGMDKENGRYKFDVRIMVPMKTKAGRKPRRLRIDIPGTYEWSNDAWTRCYIDGSSWMRKFAVKIIRELHEGREATP